MKKSSISDHPLVEENDFPEILHILLVFHIKYFNVLCNEYMEARLPAFIFSLWVLCLRISADGTVWRSLEQLDLIIIKTNQICKPGTKSFLSILSSLEFHRKPSHLKCPDSITR